MKKREKMGQKLNGRNLFQTCVLALFKNTIKAGFLVFKCKSMIKDKESIIINNTSAGVKRNKELCLLMLEFISILARICLLQMMMDLPIHLLLYGA